MRGCGGRYERCLSTSSASSSSTSARPTCRPTENRVVQGSSQQAWVVWWSDDAGWRYLVEDTRDPDASWGRTGWFTRLLGKDADDDALLDAVRVEVPDFVGTIRRGWPAQTP